MEAFGIKYPFLLGANNKNELPKQGGVVTKGRWVNTNHEDWSNPNWKQVKCKATLMDRSLGKGKFTLFGTDVAAMTVYEDTVLNMVKYDLVPVKSTDLDMNNQPPQDIEESYNWPVYDVQTMMFLPIEPEFETPYEKIRIPYAMGGIGIMMLAIRYFNRPTFK